MHSKTLREKIVKEYLLGDSKYAILSSKYGVSISSICLWVKSYKSMNSGKQKKKYNIKPKEVSKGLESSVLESKIRELELENALLKKIIELAEVELGVEITKKSGTKQSTKSTKR